MKNVPVRRPDAETHDSFFHNSGSCFLRSWTRTSRYLAVCTWLTDWPSASIQRTARSDRITNFFQYFYAFLTRKGDQGQHHLQRRQQISISEVSVGSGFFKFHAKFHGNSSLYFKTLVIFSAKRKTYVISTEATARQIWLQTLEWRQTKEKALRAK